MLNYGAAQYTYLGRYSLNTRDAKIVQVMLDEHGACSRDDHMCRVAVISTYAMIAGSNDYDDKKDLLIQAILIALSLGDLMRHTLLW